MSQGTGGPVQCINRINARLRDRVYCQLRVLGGGGIIRILGRKSPLIQGKGGCYKGIDSGELSVGLGGVARGHVKGKPEPLKSFAGIRE